MKAIFLDRDGTLIKNFHYLSSPERIRFTPCALDFLRLARKKEYLIFVITNQSGIKRGYFSRDRLEAIHRELLLRLKSEKIAIEGIFYCDHHPNERCSCRKPKPYLIKRVLFQYPLDLAGSFMVGDRPEDVALGYSMGIKTIYLGNPESLAPGLTPHFVSKDFCNLLYIL